MEIAFETLELRQICQQREVCVDTYGKDVANEIQQIISDLRTAPSLADLPLPVENVSKDIYVIKGILRIAIEFAVNHHRKKAARTEDLVYRIKILSIQND